MLEHQTELELKETKVLVSELKKQYKTLTEFEALQIAVKISQNSNTASMTNAISRAFGSFPSDHSKTYLELIASALGDSKEDYAESLQTIANSLFAISEKM